ncbi:dienelactone hydrolase family protein [Arcticibacterium luteifluviistationis]|uniref:Dienelactone hydrolase n=1 Tax=Arcticibacterium luteifluviistationis TaxID=1784714 RepID=A0A2Z4GA24_9BACT|nr:dienelactone hydrolase family protein [Arcticibacterium luteifluviistationis]AWV97925.1 dienelactone hydrolase [Arcticibacterium luteifluviistationis]
MLKLSAFFLLFWTYLGFNTEPEVNTEITMCHNVMPESMADFVNDPEFVKMHPTPLQINLEVLGEEIKISSPDGKDAGAYFIKAKTNSNKWLLVYQEWWGLNDNIRNEANTYFKKLNEEVNILALDMYDGKTTTNPDEAGKLMSGADQTRLENIMKAGITYAGSDAKIASVGWCFGGGLSLRSALLEGQQAVGTVMYYGMPVNDVEQLKALNSDVLGLFATEKWISKEVIDEFAANMKKADKKLTYIIFDAVHGFANPSNPKHDPDATLKANRMSTDYLKTKFEISVSTH